MNRGVAPLLFGALAVLAVGAPSLWLLKFGPLAGHMAVHIALMNVAAPLLAVLLVRAGPFLPAKPNWIWTACIVQLALLWAAHTPAVHRAAISSPVLQASMWTALFLAALAFWTSLASRSEGSPWREILALLLTGKLACLLGALLAFAPRSLYASAHHPTPDLSDQQVAGLLMIAACPLSYVAAGLVFAARMLTDLRRKADETPGLPAGGRQMAA